MKTVVIGLGSMGKRRISLLSEFSGIEIIGVDSNKERCEEAAEKFGIKTYASLKDAVKCDNPEAAFVCTAPLFHGEIINDCLNNNLNVFTEINLIDDYYEENIKLAKQKGKVLFLSSTFLYRFENRRIIEKASASKEKLNYVYHVGQYLPDWHPWENFQNFFVGNKRTNGCREIFAIELPWLVTAFGEVSEISAVKDNITSLNLGYFDNYMVQIKHKNGNKGVFTVDVASRKAVRKFELIGENIYLTWDGTPETLFEYDFENKKNIQIKADEAQNHREGYAEFVTESPYKEEISAFIKTVSGDKTAAKWNFEKDLAVLKLIDKIEE